MSPLVRISESAQKGWSHILVDAAYAEDLHRKLRSLQLGSTPLQDIFSFSVKVVASTDGGKQVVTETFHRAFDVQATPKSLEPVVVRWAATLL